MSLFHGLGPWIALAIVPVALVTPGLYRRAIAALRKELGDAALR